MQARRQSCEILPLLRMPRLGGLVVCVPTQRITRLHDQIQPPGAETQALRNVGRLDFVAIKYTKSRADGAEQAVVTNDRGFKPSYLARVMITVEPGRVARRPRALHLPLPDCQRPLSYRSYYLENIFQLAGPMQ